QGAGNIKRLYPGATTVFLMPPTMEELERRLRSRGTDSEQAIQNRLRRAEAEIALSADYDEHVVNDVVETCAAEIYDIIREKLAAPQ
ncbi:MAG: guanylate kinase, partial [Gemmiger sp.]|nr:guanylate kinase [Gemmiger sp.]